MPSSYPTFFPTSTPTNTLAPSDLPSFGPTKYPSLRPTSNPTAESDMEHCFIATMQGREYDTAVDDGLNEAVKDIFGVLAEIHVLIDYVACSTTDQCEMRYCLIVEQDFGDIVEEAISTHPSDLEEAWENNLRSLNDPSPEFPDLIVMEINYSAAFNLNPVDTFFGNWELLSAITLGTGALCCSFICICLRMKRSEIKILLVEDSPKVEMSTVPRRKLHDDPINISQNLRISGSLEIIEPGSIAKNEILEPGSIRYPQNSKVNSRSIEEKRVMEMPLPDGVTESSDSELKIGERQQSRYEGQTEISRVIISPTYSEDGIARPAEYEYEEIARPAKIETTRGH